MNINLSTLEIKILLKCSEFLLSRSYLPQLYRRYNKKEREIAIKNLINHGLLLAQEMPKAGARKTPVFYKITDKGKKWLFDYNQNYPK